MADVLSEPLTMREQQVLDLVAFGLSNKEIADRLVLSRRTVEWHIDHLLAKLGVATRARAVIEAERIGLIGRKADISDDGSSARQNNLPLQLTALLGRERDIAEVKMLLSAHRLLTLCGSGGVGKTRLALGVGVDLLDLYQDGVWFCDFSPLSNPTFVSSVVAKALSVRNRPNRPLAESISHSLRRKHALLIMDNCEHVLGSAAELVDEVLHNAPAVRVLATSRQSLGIIGEVVHRVRSLEVPETARGIGAEALARYGAIALLIERAQASDIAFVLDSDNAPVAVDVCRRLDGIPLAIEMAAARIGRVSLRGLAQSLNDRFKVLTGGSRTALPRHQTLAALVGWSYDLLSSGEQTLFNRLGIFAGSFSVGAAIAVCSGDGLDESVVSGLLISLVDKSLVVAQVGRQQERYRLLETTRAYALERLATSGERERLARTFAEFFRDQAKVTDESYGLDSTPAWLASVGLELDNHRAAMQWGLMEGNDVPLGAAVAGSLKRFWLNSSLASEGRHWIETALERLRESEEPSTAALLWMGLAPLCSGAHMYEAATRARELYELAGDDRSAGYALRWIGFALHQMGRQEEASEAIAGALDRSRKYGDKLAIATCLNYMGTSSYQRGDFGEGRDFLTQALAAAREAKNETTTAHVLHQLAELEFADGHAEQALHLMSDVLEILSKSESAVGLSTSYMNVTAYRIALADLDGARDSAQKALRLGREVENDYFIAVTLQHFALIAATRAQTQGPVRLMGWADAKLRQLGIERGPTEKWAREKLATVLRERFSQAEIDELAAEGAAWPDARAVEEALSV